MGTGFDRALVFFFFFYLKGKGSGHFQPMKTFLSKLGMSRLLPCILFKIGKQFKLDRRRQHVFCISTPAFQD